VEPLKCLALDLHVEIIKGGVEKYGMSIPGFKTSPVEPISLDYWCLKGFLVDEFSGKQ